MNTQQQMIKYLIRIKQKIKNILGDGKEQRHALVGPANLWKMKRDFQIAFLKDSGLMSNQSLLDIGCGTLRGGIPIIDYLEKGNYTGIDVRKKVLDEAQKELKAEKLEQKSPKLVFFEEFSQLNLETKFDYVFAFSVLFHLEDSIVEKCFEFVSRHLSEVGVFYANIHTGEYPDGQWQGFPVAFRSLDFYEVMAKKYQLNTISRGSLEKLGHTSSLSGHDNQIMLRFTFKK